MRYIMPILFVLLWAVIIFAAKWNIETTVQPMALYCVRVEAVYPVGEGIALSFCVSGNDERPAAPVDYLRKEA